MDSASMAAGDDTRRPARAQPTEAALNRLDDQGLTIAKRIVAQLFRSSDQSLGVESRIAALAVVIAVHPDRDVWGFVTLWPVYCSHVIFETSSMTCARATRMVSTATINASATAKVGANLAISSIFPPTKSSISFLRNPQFAVMFTCQSLTHQPL